MDNSTLKFLGRDSGFGQKNTSTYYIENSKFILIDCGFTVFEELKNTFDLSKFNEFEIIITHLHNDHAGSLSQLILYIWFILNKKTTVISNCKNIETYLNITGTPRESYDLKTSLVNLMFIKTEHVKYLDAYGFKFNINNKNIIYTGDTCNIEPFLPFMDNCDELYIDVSKFGGAHLKIEEIYDKLLEIKKNGTKIFLMHMDDKQFIEDVTNNEFYC